MMVAGSFRGCPILRAHFSRNETLDMVETEAMGNQGIHKKWGPSHRLIILLDWQAFSFPVFLVKREL